MPNWCSNTVEFDFTDATPEIKETLKKVSADYSAHGNQGDKVCFFDAFYPCPQDLKVDHKWPESEAMIENQKKHGFSSWYDWCNEHWGTKWDACDLSITVTEDKVLGYFSTAWAPPIGFYAFMEDSGVKVDAKYAESGMDYAGFYKNGNARDLDKLSDSDAREKYLADFPFMADFILEIVADFEDDNK